MKTRLERTADRMNIRLDAMDTAERWVLDTDATSNSVGTWFCGNVGGVTQAGQMLSETEKILTQIANSRTVTNYQCYCGIVRETNLIMCDQCEEYGEPTSRPITPPFCLLGVGEFNPGVVVSPETLTGGEVTHG